MNINSRQIFSIGRVIPFCMVALLSSAGRSDIKVDPPAVTAEVTGNLLSVNGTTQVERRLFGVHATALSPERIADWGVESVRLIHQNPSTRPVQLGSKPYDTLRNLPHVLECFYDRYQPARILTHRQTWEEDLKTLGRTYGSNARGLEKSRAVEFWNEPYLNWSVKPGVNYDGDLYDVGRAREDGPVHFAGESTPIPDLRWHRGLMAVDASNGSKDYLAWGYAPKTVIDQGVERPPRAGDEYDFRRRKRMKLVEHWLVRDDTQISYWAGRYNAELYRRMLLPFARSLKEANPNVEVVGGFDFHLYQGNWDAWRTCFAPMIDNCWNWIDGVDEHHYGEDTRRTAASYEVVAAYSQTKFGKMLRGYNTEAGGMLDPQRPDSVGASAVEGSPLERAIGAMTYSLRDLVYLLDKCPDKAVTRYAHQAELNGGDEWTFRLLKPLRGRLLECKSSDPSLWLIGSVDQAKVCIVAFNDSTSARPSKIRLRLPEDRLAKSLKRAWIEPDAERAGLVIREEDLGKPAEREIILEAKIPPRNASRWVIDVTNLRAIGQETQRKQYFSPAVLTSLKAGEAASFAIAYVNNETSASEARLRLALSGECKGLEIRFNGQPMKLEQVEPIVDLPIEPRLLQSRNVIEAKISEGHGQIDACSLLVDGRKP